MRPVKQSTEYEVKPGDKCAVLGKMKRSNK